MMELWIRSQDRKMLSKTMYIEYSEWNEEHRIYINGGVYGKYKTKERALEVLDEIQKAIEDGVFKERYEKHSGCYIGTNVPIYEMPKE